MTRVAEPGIPSTQRSRAVPVGRAPAWLLVLVPAMLQDPLIQQATRQLRVLREPQHRRPHRYHRNQSSPLQLPPLP